MDEIIDKSIIRRASIQDERSRLGLIEEIMRLRKYISGLEPDCYNCMYGYLEEKGHNKCCTCETTENWKHRKITYTTKLFREQLFI